MQNRPHSPILFVLLAVISGLGGCITQPKTAEVEDSAVTAEAPLGSRIKRQSDANPLSQANRQQYEQERVKMGAIQTGIANSPK